MEYVIWGVTRLGRYAAKNMAEKGISVKPLAFVDQNPEIQDTREEGIPIMSFEGLQKMDHRENVTVLIAMRNAGYIFQALDRLEKERFANVGIIKSGSMVTGAPVDLGQKGGGIIWSATGGRRCRVIPRIEMNLTDACNLKCRGCTHFSGIFPMDSIYPYKDYRKDLLQLRTIGRVLRIRLLGGEPFLLNNLDEYITTARDIFPESDIELVTNGLLIPGAEKRVLSAIGSCGLCVVISPYKPTLRVMDQISRRLEEHGILWRLDGEEILTFSRNVTLKDGHDGAAASRNCPSSACTFLRKGRLYKCPVDGLFGDFCGYYGLEDGAESGTDLYGDVQEVYGALADYAQNPVCRCGFCVENPELIPWSVKASPQVKDWLYRDGEE